MSSTPTPASVGQQQQVANPSFLPELAAFAVILVWGSTFTLTKSLYAEMSPLAFGASRFMVITSIAFLVLWFSSKRAGRKDWMRIKRKDLPLFVVTGVLGYTCYQLGFILGLQHTSPFAGALMIASSTPLVSLLIVRFLGERQSLVVWVGALIAVLGVSIFLMSGDDGSKLLGNVIAFGGGVSFAFYQVLNRRLVREYHAATFSAWSTLFGCIPLVIIGTPAMINQSWGDVSGTSWLAFLYMCVFPVYLAYLIWSWAIRQRGVPITGFQLMVPIVAGLMSWVFYDEQFGPVKLLGGAVAVIGLVIMQWANLRQSRQARAAAR